MKSIKITVKRIACYKDLVEQYENPISHTCDMKLNEFFVSNNGEKPANFCDEAWNCISKYVFALSSGSENFYDGWMKNPKSAMISCNDGFRPVSFLLEVIDE